MFAEKIISWYKKNKRDLPWRYTLDPYKIWLSEIILQQTRVAQGLPYYNSFVTKFTTVKDLANASESDVLRTWQGLGYYSRARNLHHTAKLIYDSYNGIFPDNFEELKKLKGVGNYTAAAIASFAFKQRVPAVDGNMMRVFSRYFEYKEPIDSPKAQKDFFRIGLELIKKVDASDFNQAVMELGAIVCSPKNPKCNECPLQNNCVAFANKTQLIYPIKSKKIKVFSISQ
jgi:A/G-specific adenine glycosylase